MVLGVMAPPPNPAPRACALSIAVSKARQICVASRTEIGPERSRAASVSPVAFIGAQNLNQESGPGIRRGRSIYLTPALLNLDCDLHAEGEVGRAIALVGSLGRVGERHFVGLVRLRQERSRQIIDGVLYAGLDGCRATGGKGVLPERDVVRSARHVGEAHGRTHGDGDRAGLVRGAAGAVT